MPKRWRIRPHDSGQIARLEREAGVSAVVAQLLAARGIYDAATVKSFLDPKLNCLRDPEELPGLNGAVERIHAAVSAGKPIVIYGDYDADGMTATAILTNGLRLLGAAVSYYVPNRIDEGYGLNDGALRVLAERGAQMVITVDCGICSIGEAQTAREIGIELIITDHHEMKDELPAAAALVHPRLPGYSYPFAGLSGAGVAFKLAWALCQRSCQAKRVTDAMRDFLLQAVGLAALGTVADVVPLVDENRILVYHGLFSLRQRPTLGIAALMQLTKLDQKATLECEDVGFTLAPRLNAAGRLGQALLGVELLTTQSSDRANALAEYLHELNSSRDSLERSIFLAANKQVQERFDAEGDSALVLAAQGWHPGVIGIVAGRLAEKYHRPVALIAQDEIGVKPGIGSVRSVPGFSVHEALAACTHLLISHGGHAAAGGLKIEDQHVAAFREEFCEVAAKQLRKEHRTAELWIDGETLLASLTLRAVEQIEQLAPFGQGNHRPLLCASNVRLAEPPKRIGTSGRHLSLRLEQHGAKLRGVAFGNGDWADELADVSGPLNIAFKPVINNFNGRRSVELHVCDWCLPESAEIAHVG
ncbi:MAG: single-stranded-DNA-specific exonuclease RecJ [Pirellulales bacterium]|nr:single-stranded-DNA-specific exonuclease RecJ [Pirellulales bacterium]